MTDPVTAAAAPFLTQPTPHPAQAMRATCSQAGLLQPCAAIRPGVLQPPSRPPSPCPRPTAWLGWAGRVHCVCGEGDVATPPHLTVPPPLVFTIGCPAPSITYGCSCRPEELCVGACLCTCVLQHMCECVVGYEEAVVMVGGAAATACCSFHCHHSLRPPGFQV